MQSIKNKKSSKARTLLLLFIFLAQIFNLAQSQGGFKKLYFLPNSLTSTCRNVVETPNGDLITLGFTLDTSQNVQYLKLTIIGTDAKGNFLWRKDYGNKNFSYNNYTENGWVDSTGFYQAIPAKDQGARTFGVLIKFNFQGDTVWQKIFRDPNPLDDIIPLAVTRSLDGGFLLPGFFQNWGASGDRKLLLLKTDRNGQELWRQKLPGTSTNWQKVIVGYGLVEDVTTKRILITGFQYLGNSPTVYTTYGSVFCCDSIGNSIWQKAFTSPSSEPFTRIIRLSGGNFITGSGDCTVRDQWGDCLWYKNYVVMFDIDGNTIWNKTYDENGKTNWVHSFTELNNGDILYVGACDTSSVFSLYGQTSTQIGVLDLQGNRLFSKKIGTSSPLVNSSSEIPFNLNPTKDGGFVIPTYKFDLPNPQPFSIIKIDSTYCDTTEQYCRDVLTDIKTEKRNTQGFELYPNPVRGELFINLTKPSETNYLVKIFEVSGRLVKEVAITSGEKNSLSLTEVKAGIYFVSLYAEESCVATKKIVVVE